MTSARCMYPVEVPHPDEIFDPPLTRIDEAVAEIGRLREAALIEIAKRDTGNCVPPDKAEQNEREEVELLGQSRELIRRLRAQGIEMERNTPWELFTYFVHSRRVIRQPQFRRCMVIPWTAKQVRAPMLRALESFLESNPFARMWVFTAGPRVEAGPRGETLRRTITRFHRRLNRLAIFLGQFGLEMVFRSTELGTPEFRARDRDRFDPEDTQPVADRYAGCIETCPETGKPLFHVHAHVLIVSKVGFIRPDRWQSIIRAVWDRWAPDFWSAGKKGQSSIVRDARELCKYLTKPAEMLRLKPTDLVDVVTGLRRLKMAVPMGSFRSDIERLQRRKHRLDRCPTPDGPVFRTVPDWNKFGESTDLERQLERAKRLGERGEREPDIKIVSRIAARCAPNSCVKEPAVTVLAVRWNEDAIRRHRLVAPLIEATAGEWLASEKIRVHTCTLGGHEVGTADPPGVGPPAVLEAAK